MISGSVPNISLEVTTKHINDVAVYHFVCKTNFPSMTCSVEYHKNNHTLTSLRFETSTCINRNGGCTPNLCSCSKECKVFTLNVETTSDVLNSTLGCEARLNVSGYIFVAREVQKFDGKGNLILKKSHSLVFPVGINHVKMLFHNKDMKFSEFSNRS